MIFDGRYFRLVGSAHNNTVLPLIIPAPLEFQKKVSSTSNNSRPLIIPAYGTKKNYIGRLGKLFLYFLDLKSKNSQRIVWDRFK